MKVLEEAMTTCARSQQCTILFCDEICSIVSELDDSIISHLCEEVTNSFQEAFLVEVTDGVPGEVGVPAEFRYGLDSTEEGSIALNLLPMVVASKTNPEGGVVGMAAKFHLLRTCEKQLNGNLEGVDALLGIVHFPPAVDSLYSWAIQSVLIRRMASFQWTLQWVNLIALHAK